MDNRPAESDSPIVPFLRVGPPPDRTRWEGWQQWREIRDTFIPAPRLSLKTWARLMAPPTNRSSSCQPGSVAVWLVSACTSSSSIMAWTASRVIGDWSWNCVMAAKPERGGAAFTVSLPPRSASSWLRRCRACSVSRASGMAARRWRAVVPWGIVPLSSRGLVAEAARCWAVLVCWGGTLLADVGERLGRERGLVEQPVLDECEAALVQPGECVVDHVGVAGGESGGCEGLFGGEGGVGHLPDGGVGIRVPCSRGDAQGLGQVSEDGTVVASDRGRLVGAVRERGVRLPVGCERAGAGGGAGGTGDRQDVMDERGWVLLGDLADDVPGRVAAGPE
ncbi:hypothetical protein [Kitasatospora sp. MMS16-BH015]|uniref:hypothetical protein n=1 Tax=Kitasatospora sp. MMS16-BH015 TaxID=2018025 RepID=UPI000CF259B5|nr:hypothetical protein [Kitasatospora sp. MMS16-BH015]